MEITTTDMQTTPETQQPDTNTPETKEINKLFKYHKMQNIAAKDGGADLTQDELLMIGNYVETGYSKDEADRAEWLERYEKGIRGAMQLPETKNTPFDNASNVKYPMISSASQQFHARSYGAIIKGADIVKGKVIGPDPDKKVQEVADAIAQHMSNQLLEEMVGWVDGLDKTLAQLPNIGCVFKKTYYSSIKKQNISEYCTAKSVVVKYDAVSIEDAPRITHLLSYETNDILGFERSGRWRKTKQTIQLFDKDTEIKDAEDTYDYLEQHCWYDLDDDGYKEPYVITIEKETNEVVSIISRYDTSGIELNDKNEIIRIKAVDYFTRYWFLPSPDGGIYGMGFNTLIGPINDVVDTLLNQMIDAGTIDNSNSGFISSKLKLGKKRQQAIKFQPNTWNMVDSGVNSLKDSILPIPSKGPSTVLFQLLGVVMEAGKELSSVTDIMTGQQRGANESPTTVMAYLEQGTMVFTAIYKRIYRSLKGEFKKVKRLNRIYADKLPGMDEQMSEAYRMASVDIIPIADPSDATNMQKIAKANALMQLKGQGLNDEEITRRYLSALDIEDMEKLFPKGPQPPNPAIVLEQEKLKIEQTKVAMTGDANMLNRQRFEFEMVTEKINQRKIISETILNLAKAEAAEEGTQLDIYKAQLDSLTSELEALNANKQPRVGNVQGQQDISGNQQ